MIECRKNTKRVLRGCIVGFLLLCLGCTKADIEAILPYANDKLSVEGDFCTTDPSNVIYETRILFLVDCSGSMRLSDPTGLRADAIAQVIDTFKDSPSVLFGLILFGSTTEITTQGFEKDTAALTAALKPIKDDNGTGKPINLLGTNYISVLKEALNFITKDRAVNYSENEVSYVIVFITDGAPDSQDFDPNLTVQKIFEQIRALKAMDVIMHTLLLATVTQGVPPEFLTLLEDMAHQCYGQYRELGSAAAITDALGELLDLKKILRVFNLRELLVVNQSAVLTKQDEDIGFFADSDGDGLADFQEIELGTYPTKADSDDDGISDLVELRTGSDPMATEQHPDDWYADTDNDQVADMLEDEDHDGLNTYEEQLLGTNPKLFDTDLDGIPDGLEVRFGTNYKGIGSDGDPIIEFSLSPVVGDQKGDYDADFVPNIDEVRAGTSANLVEGALRTRLAYDYTIEQTGRNLGRYCYKFRVDNITLRTPLASSDRPEGLNRIQVIAVDTPVDNPGVVENQILSSTEIIFRVPSYRRPNALTLFLNGKDFE